MGGVEEPLWFDNRSSPDKSGGHSHLNLETFDGSGSTTPAIVTSSSYNGILLSWSA